MLRKRTNQKAETRFSKNEMLGKRLYDIKLEMEELLAEDKSIRADLDASLTAEQEVLFQTPEGPYKVKKRREEVAVMKDNKKVIKLIGLETFLAIASVTKGKLKDLGNSLYTECVDRWEVNYKVVLAKATKKEG